MNKYSAYAQIGFAVLLYLLSAITFIDYLYSLVIPDTVTAVENAFGKLVILIFMLVMAKFSMAAGKLKLKKAEDTGESSLADENTQPGAGREAKTAPENELDTSQQASKKEAEI